MNTETTDTSLYDALKAEYGKVEVLDNGMYHVWKGRTQLWIPSNTTSTSDVAVWYPGGGGEGNDAGDIKKLCNGSNPPDYIVAVSSFSGNTGGTAGNVFSNVTSSLQNCDISVNKGVGIAFSDSGNTMLKQFNESVRGDSDTASRFELFEIEGAWVNSKCCSAGNLDAISEYNVPVHYISGNNSLSSQYKASAEYLNENGVNCSFIQSDQKSHIATNSTFWQSGVVDYCFGNSTEIKNNSSGNNPNYQLYNYDNGNWTAGTMSSIVLGNTTNTATSLNGSAAASASETTPLGASGSSGGTTSGSTMTLEAENSYDTSTAGGGDINLPTYSELDYTINKIASVKSAYASALSSMIGSFDTMGLDLKGADSGLSSMKASVNKITGGDSTLEQAYTVLKNVETKLREMDSNYDLFVAVDYLNNLNENDGELNILGSTLSDSDKEAVFDKVAETLDSNADLVTTDTNGDEAAPTTLGTATPTANTQNLNITYLDKTPSSLKSLNGQDYYLGTQKLSVNKGAQQGYMEVGGKKYSTDSSSGKLYITYEDESGNTKSYSFSVPHSGSKNPHLGGVYVEDKGDDSYVYLPVGDSIEKYSVGDIMNGGSTSLGKTTAGDIQKGNNNSGRISWIGDGGDGLVMAGQYENAKGTSAKYKNNGNSSSTIAFYDTDTMKQVSLYNVNGSDITNLQGGCKGSDGYLYLTSSTSAGNSKIYVAKLKNEGTITSDGTVINGTVELLGSTSLPGLPEQVSFTDDGRLAVTYEGNQTYNTNGYVTYLDPEKLKDNVIPKDNITKV